VFHLELFVAPDTGECAFLEVGARVGGAEIPFLWREVHGYDLMEAGFRLAMGWSPRAWPAGLGVPSPAAYAVADTGTDGSVAGWLLAPAPAARPCRITEATPMVGRVPGPYAEALLRPGEVLPAAAAYYEHVGGRFRFRGHTSAEVEAAVSATARDFRVRAE
jgi:biotin carboxylase